MALRRASGHGPKTNAKSLVMRLKSVMAPRYLMMVAIRCCMGWPMRMPRASTSLMNCDLVVEEGQANSTEQLSSK